MADDIHTVRHPETGEEMDHYEWNGWMWCEPHHEAFDFDSDECPHCEVEL